MIKHVVRLATGLTVGLTILATASVSADPPIFQPGAPGTASRIVTPDESVGLAATGYTADDVGFMQHMIVHHGQAVEMGALIATRTDNPGIALMGERISRSQTSEIEMMQAWLQRRGHSTRMQHAPTSHAGMSSHEGHAMPGHARSEEPSDVPLMTGMLSPAQMAELAAAHGDDFDRLYLVGMIHHHQGAIDMVDDLLAETGNGEDTQLSEFLSAIIADQSAEISRMSRMLAGL